MKINKLINERPLIMGILNLSDNSFYKESILKENKSKYLEEFISYCDILDIGAESTHPGASPITSEEEISRLIPILKICNNYNIPISVDTYKSDTAKFAINNNVAIINDISGGTLDNKMFETIKDKNIIYILGHIQNKPENMQNNPHYNNVINEIYEYFNNRICILTNMGFTKENIYLDPCIGFGKLYTHNIEILNNIEKFKKLGCPIVIGTSRKHFHKHITKINNDYEMLIATLTTNIYSILNGADIIRVHDPKEFKIVKDIILKIKENS